MSIGCLITLSQARIKFDINCPIYLSKLVILSRYACPVVTKLRVIQFFSNRPPVPRRDTRISRRGGSTACASAAPRRRWGARPPTPGTWSNRQDLKRVQFSEFEITSNICPRNRFERLRYSARARNHATFQNNNRDLSYRVTLVVEYLGCVDLNLGCSTISL